MEQIGHAWLIHAKPSRGDVLVEPAEDDPDFMSQLAFEGGNGVVGRELHRSTYGAQQCGTSSVHFPMCYGDPRAPPPLDRYGPHGNTAMRSAESDSCSYACLVFRRRFS